MSHSDRDEQVVNLSNHNGIAELIEARLSRRDFLQAASALTASALLPMSGCATTPLAAAPGFTRVGVSTDDVIHVPPGYTATPFYKWGDPIGHPSGSPQFKPDASSPTT